MIFVYDVFDCVLRILVIQLTLLLLYPIVGHAIDLPFESHSIALLSLNHSIDLSSSLISSKFPTIAFTFSST